LFDLKIFCTTFGLGGGPDCLPWLRYRRLEYCFRSVVNTSDCNFFHQDRPAQRSETTPGNQHQRRSASGSTTATTKEKKKKSQTLVAHFWLS